MIETSYSSFTIAIVSPLHTNLNKQTYLSRTIINFCQKSFSTFSKKDMIAKITKLVLSTLSSIGLNPFQTICEYQKKLYSYQFFANLIEQYYLPEVYPLTVEDKDRYNTYNEHFFFILFHDLLLYKENKKNSSWKPLYVGCYREFLLPREVLLDGDTLYIKSQNKIYYKQLKGNQIEALEEDNWQLLTPTPLFLKITSQFDRSIVNIPSNNNLSLKNITKLKDTIRFYGLDKGEIIYLEQNSKVEVVRKLATISQDFFPVTLATKGSILFALGFSKKKREAQLYYYITRWNYYPLLLKQNLNIHLINQMEIEDTRNGKEIRIAAYRNGKEGYIYSVFRSFYWQFNESFLKDADDPKDENKIPKDLFFLHPLDENEVKKRF